MLKFFTFGGRKKKNKKTDNSFLSLKIDDGSVFKDLPSEMLWEIAYSLTPDAFLYFAMAYLRFAQTVLDNRFSFKSEFFQQLSKAQYSDRSAKFIKDCKSESRSQDEISRRQLWKALYLDENKQKIRDDSKNHCYLAIVTHLRTLTSKKPVERDYNEWKEFRRDKSRPFNPYMPIITEAELQSQSNKTELWRTVLQDPLGIICSNNKSRAMELYNEHLTDVKPATTHIPTVCIIVRMNSTTATFLKVLVKSIEEGNWEALSDITTRIDLGDQLQNTESEKLITLRLKNDPKVDFLTAEVFCYQVKEDSKSNNAQNEWIVKVAGSDRGYSN